MWTTLQVYGIGRVSRRSAPTANARITIDMRHLTQVEPRKPPRTLHVEKGL